LPGKTVVVIGLSPSILELFTCSEPAIQIPVVFT
jgi:hypothetical protein